MSNSGDRCEGGNSLLLLLFFVRGKDRGSTERISNVMIFSRCPRDLEVISCHLPQQALQACIVHILQLLVEQPYQRPMIGQDFEIDAMKIILTILDAPN